MSCNHCSTVSTAPAAAAGAPDIEANWAANRAHPQYCPTCGAFLRADGGCTKCEGRQPFSVTADGQNITMLPVESSAVKALGYDPASRQAAVEFTSGQIYAYHGVSPEEFDQVRGAASIGEAVNRQLKPHAFTPLGRAATVPATDAPDAGTLRNLRDFLRDDPRMAGQEGTGSAAIQLVAQEIRAGRWAWGDGNYPKVAEILADPAQRQYISDADAETVLGSARPEWYKDATSFRLSLKPDTIAEMEPPEATLALGRVFDLAKKGEWAGGPREENWRRLTDLYAKANLSHLDADTVAAGYQDLLRNSNAAGAREVTLGLVNNRTAPPLAVAMAAEEMAFDAGYKKAELLPLTGHPNLDGAAQEWLAASPDPGVRRALAASPRAHEAVLDRLLQDNNESVALTAMRNFNSPHSTTAADNRDAGISDAETLRVLRRKTHSWQNLPRCGQCGAWTKADGVCHSKRCGGYGRIMAAPHNTARQGAFRVAAPIRRRLDDHRSRAAAESVLTEWQAAAAHGQFPAEWQAALPSAISELVVTGRWETPTGDAILWKDGHYQIFGIPVPAKNAGDAVKTYFAQLGRGDQTVTDKDPKTGVESTRPRWRYSEGHNAVVDYATPEPDYSFLQGRAITGGTGGPASPPQLPGAWKQTASTKELSTWEGPHNCSLVVHGPDSDRYAWLKDGEDFQMQGAELGRALKTIGGWADTSLVPPPMYRQVWGFPAAENSQRNLDAPNGVWVAADGFRLMVLANQGEAIPNHINAHPSLQKMIPSGPVTMGKGGLAFRGKQGHLLETEANPGDPFDFNRVIPYGEPPFKFRVTGKVPKEALTINSSKLGTLVADKGEVFMAVQDNETKTFTRFKVGETDDNAATGPQTSVNMSYFNDLSAVKPAAGHWEMGVFSPTAPLVVKHSSRQALGAIMPMYTPKGL